MRRHIWRANVIGNIRKMISITPIAVNKLYFVCMTVSKEYYR